MDVELSKWPFNIKADEKTDNGPALMAMRELVAKEDQPHYNIYLPEGKKKILYDGTRNRWLYGIHSYDLFGSNTELQSIYIGDDDIFHRPIFPGELFQNNVLEYIGKKEYQQADKIKSVKAGETAIVIPDQPAGNYQVGNRVLIYARNLFHKGYPVPPLYFEWAVIDNISAGKISLSMPLINSYSEAWQDLSVFAGGGAGQPRIINLDRIQHVYPKYAGFHNISFCRSTGGGRGNFVVAAENLVMNKCIIEDWLWISETRNAEINDVLAANIELDKICDTVTFNRFKTPGSPVNGGSINKIVFNDSHTGSMRACPRHLETNNHTYWASRVIKDQEKGLYDYAIPCIANAPAKNPIRTYVINNPDYTRDLVSEADSIAEFAPFEQIIIEQSGSDILVKDLSVVATMEEGVTVLFHEAGQKGGVVSSIEYDEKISRFRVKGNWDDAIATEKWLWCHVQNVIDTGFSKNKTGLSWGNQSIRWKGNITSALKTMNLTQDDFAWKSNGNANRLIDIYGAIIKIDCIVQKPCPAMINLVSSDPYQTLMETSVSRVQQISDMVKSTIPGMKWVKQLYLNTFNVVGEITPNFMPKFDITVLWKPF
jgi:hypothetical protein